MSYWVRAYSSATSGVTHGGLLGTSLPWRGIWEKCHTKTVDRRRLGTRMAGGQAIVPPVSSLPLGAVPSRSLVLRVPGGVDVAHLEAGAPRGMQLVPGGVNGVYLETWSPPRTRERRTRRACRQSS